MATMASRVCAIVGVGPGIGGAVAKRFAAEGYTVALMARNAEKLEFHKKQIEGLGQKAIAVSVDATLPTSVKSAFDTIRASVGHPEVLVVNTGAFKMGGILDLTPDDFVGAWQSNCLAGFLCAQQVLPAMVEHKSGTIIFTGATGALRCGAGFSGLGVGKFGQRAVAQSISREFGPKGIHVVHVVIDGFVNLETTRAHYPNRPIDSYVDPEAVATQYWNLHQQDKTVWTQELELRPYAEKW